MQGRKVSGRTPEADDDIPIVLLKEESLIKCKSVAEPDE